MLNISTPELKQRVARKFSLAAINYDEKAEVQARVSDDALSMMEQRKVEVLLDVGCGTGKVTSQLTEYAHHIVGVDLSFGMLSHAQHNNPEQQLSWVTGDFDQLPIQNNCIDGVFSSMALQWSRCAKQCFSELYRVCKPGTDLVLAIMTDGSLSELQSSWQELDSTPHINQFCSTYELEQYADLAGFSGKITQKQYQTWHASVNAVMHSIKDVGAGVVQSGSRSRLNKSKLRALQSTYARMYQQDGKLPLTYSVCFLELTK